MSKLSTYFSRSEFLCKGNNRGICSCGFDTVDVELLKVLEDVRFHFGKPVVIYSACRCKKYNAHVGGASKSKHMLGIACDIAIKGVKPSIIFRYLNDKYPKKYGIGKYHTFTHIDIRQSKARWGK